MGLFEVIGGAIGLYTVVPVSEAHIRVMNNKKDVFMSRSMSKSGPKGELEADNAQYKSGYWRTPFITKITRLPLTNIRIDVPDVKLNDKNMAKFMCDVVCFVNIDNPLLAAERTSITMTVQRYGTDNVVEDFRAILESIMRTTSTQQPLLDIYMDRDKLDSAVSTQIEKVFPQWGLRLVDLEIKDLKDVNDSTIIEDIERKIAAQISADARVKVAEETKRAEINEATNKRDAEFKKAEMEEEYRKRQIAKEQAIGIAQQEQAKMTAEREQQANTAKVEAKKAFDVGVAEVEKQATIKRAEATQQKVTLEAQGESARIKQTGEAEASIIKAKKVADAEGTEKLALAQQKFNDAATKIETIKANKEVQIAYAQSFGKMYEKATVNVVAGTTKELINGGMLGSVNVGPLEGAASNQMEILGGKNPLESISSAIGAVTKK